MDQNDRYLDQSHLFQSTVVRQVLDSFTSFKPTAPIQLDLPFWTSFDCGGLGVTDLQPIRLVLDYFQRVAIQNSLQNTGAARKLSDSISVLDSITSASDIIQIPYARRTSYSESSLPLIQPATQLELITVDDVNQARWGVVQSALNEVPILNIWDSISLIYTLCVEHVEHGRLAELHLFQFRTIVRILSSHRYFSSRAPTTAAAAWSNPDDNGIRSIAFATTCAGSGKRLDAMRRVEFAQSLIKRTVEIQQRALGILAVYRPGNCPEWITVIMVCRLPGHYSSLCLTLVKGRIYKMCGYCDELVKYFTDMNIHINDLWSTAMLGLGEVITTSENVAFSYRELLDNDTVIKISKDLSKG